MQGKLEFYTLTVEPKQKCSNKIWSCVLLLKQLKLRDRFQNQVQIQYNPSNLCTFQEIGKTSIQQLKVQQAKWEELKKAHIYSELQSKLLGKMGLVKGLPQEYQEIKSNVYVIKISTNFATFASTYDDVFCNHALAAEHMLFMQMDAVPSLAFSVKRNQQQVMDLCLSPWRTTEQTILRKINQQPESARQFHMNIKKMQSPAPEGK